MTQNSYHLQRIKKLILAVNLIPAIYNHELRIVPLLLNAL